MDILQYSHRVGMIPDGLVHHMSDSGPCDMVVFDNWVVTDEILGLLDKLSCPQDD